MLQTNARTDTLKTDSIPLSVVRLCEPTAPTSWTSSRSR